MDEERPKPYLQTTNGRQELVIPMNCDPKYRYWQGGQSVTRTLREIGASPETIKRYLRQDLGYEER